MCQIYYYVCKKNMSMKKIFCFLFFYFATLTLSAQTEKVSNQSILEMKEMGFSDEVILTKISTSDTNFDTSLSAIKQLKEKGVSDAIIVAVMNGGTTESADVAEVSTFKTGIYVKKEGEPVKILPTVFSGTKTNTLGAAFSYGIASAKIKSVMNNAESTNVINSEQPAFWFYFAKQDNNNFNVGASNWWFASASSPNEFALVKLIVKKNKRELVTGKVNAYAGSSLGIEDKYCIPFDIEIIDDYTYKVVPKQTLEAGEYCFFYQGTIPQGSFTNQSVFDFSIQAAQ